MDANCLQCPLLGNAKVPGHGSDHPRVVVVGEAPGRSEVSMGRPFVGAAGKLLRATLQGIGIDPTTVYYTNACLCHPPKNETPEDEAIECCRERLWQVIRKYHPEVVVLLGNSALKAVCPEEERTITAIQGLAHWHEELGTNVLYVTHPAAPLYYPDGYSAFVEALQKCSEIGKDPVVEEVVEDFTISKSLKQTETWLDSIPSGWVALDLEATGLDPFTDTIRCIALCADCGVFIIPEEQVHHKRVHKSLQGLLNRDHVLTVGHNARFDSQFLLKQLGIDWQWTFDTMITHYLLNEYPGHGLSHLAKVHYNAPDYDSEISATMKKDPSLIPAEDLYLYAAHDVYYTWRLREDLMEKLQEEPSIFDLYETIVHPADLALRDIELYGVLIDQEYLEELETDYMYGVEMAEVEMNRIVQEHGLAEINPRSPKQVAHFLYDVLHMPTPQVYKAKPRSTSEEVLKALPQHEFVDTLLEYRTMHKIFSTYIRPLRSLPGVDGKIHPEFLLHGTVTGRLACRKPNLQNIPAVAGPVIRDAFIAAEDSYLVEIDYEQAELRTAAFLSQDVAMMRVFAEHRDIHMETAIYIHQKPQELITRNERHFAKFVNFGLVYGRGPKSLAEVDEGGLHCTVEEAEEYINRFFQKYKQLAAWRKRTIQQAHREGYVESPLGRKRRFPLITQANAMMVERQAVNAPIQSLASDICIHALANIHRFLNEDPGRGRILLTVHDSILLELRADSVDTLLPQIIQIAETVPFDTNVPFTVSAKIGERWGDLHDWNRSE